MEQKDGQFRTLSAYLAAAVVSTLGQDPEYLTEGGFTQFGFPKSPELYKIIDSFNDGTLLVSAYQFSEILKRLRGVMISRRVSK